MIKKLFKRMTERTSEIVIAVVIVVACFALFLVILNLSFPESTGLGDLLGGGRDEPKGTMPEPQPDTAGTAGPERPADGSFIAKLTALVRRVKDKSPRAVAWSSSTEGARLADGHAVQTMARSAATVAFDDTSRVTLGSNTLLIVQRLVRSGETGERTASLVVLEGELLGTAGGGKGSIGVEVTAGKGTARLTTAPGSGVASSFRVSAEADRSASFTVYEGAATVQAGGRSVDVGRRQFLLVTPEGEPVGPRTIPVAAEALSPPDGAAYAFRSLAPKVDFSWGPVTDADKYRITIARDARFTDLVHDGTVPAPSFSHGNLKPGTYWWRVSAVVGPATGPASEPRRLVIGQDTEPPVLRVAFPEGPVEGDTFVLRGETEPGASVFLGDRAIVTDERGAFETQVALDPGATMIVVQAVDAAGNVAYASRLVTARH